MLRLLEKRWLFLQLATVSACLWGQSANAPGSTFAVASIKPTSPTRTGQLKLDYCRSDGSFVVAGTPVLWPLKYAFRQPEYAITGAPRWTNEFESAYDIEAKPDGTADNDTCREMLRTLFLERFHLVIHHEQKVSSVLFLQAPATTVKIRPGGSVRLNHSIQVKGDGRPQWPNGLTMADLAKILSSYLEYPVIDKTGLTGTYGITLDWSLSPEDGKPDLRTAVREQLGLKLSSGKAPIDMLVIDHIQRPDPN